MHTVRPFAALLAALALSACSDVTDAPLPPVGPAAKVHPTGWLQDDADDFHGNAIRQAGWDMAACRSCHGDDYAGGVVEVSCTTCHAPSPQSCSTCHGTGGVSSGPPEDLSGNTDPAARGVGAHQAHLTTAITTALRCGDCHAFGGFAHAAHIDGDGRAEVTLGPRAGAGATYDPATGSCATDCHGPSQAVTWTDVGSGAAACGTCHALPPPPATGHIRLAAGASCEGCHGAVVDADFRIVDAALHINGQVDFK